jgi:hypothetical protein
MIYSHWIRKWVVNRRQKSSNSRCSAIQFVWRYGIQTYIGIHHWNKTQPFISQPFLYEHRSSHSTPYSLCVSCNDCSTGYNVAPVTAMNVCGEWSIAPCICSARHEMEVISQLRASAALRKGGGRRAGRGSLEENFLPLSGIEPRFLGHPACCKIALPASLVRRSENC